MADQPDLPRLSTLCRKSGMAGIEAVHLITRYWFPKRWSYSNIKSLITCDFLIPTSVWVPGATANPWSFISGTSAWSCNKIWKKEASNQAVYPQREQNHRKKKRLPVEVFRFETINWDDKFCEMVLTWDDQFYLILYLSGPRIFFVVKCVFFLFWIIRVIKWNFQIQLEDSI